MSEPRARRPAIHSCTWPGCSASLTCPYHLQQHIREKHTHEKPYVCQTCAAVGKETSFARNASLLRHLRTVHRLEVDASGGYGNNFSPAQPQTEHVENNLRNLLGNSPTTYSSPADSHYPAPSESPDIGSNSSTPASAPAHSPPWSPVLDSATPASETATFDPAFEPSSDYLTTDDTVQGPTRCACCQTVVEDIRTHFNSCLFRNATPDSPTAFDEELADLHAFSAYLDVYEVSITQQQPTQDRSPWTGTDDAAGPPHATLSDTTIFDGDEMWIGQVMELD